MRIVWSSRFMGRYPIQRIPFTDLYPGLAHQLHPILLRMRFQELQLTVMLQRIPKIRIGMSLLVTSWTEFDDEIVFLGNASSCTPENVMDMRGSVSSADPTPVGLLSLPVSHNQLLKEKVILNWPFA